MELRKSLYQEYMDSVEVSTLGLVFLGHIMVVLSCASMSSMSCLGVLARPVDRQSTTHTHIVDICECSRHLPYQCVDTPLTCTLAVL